MFKFEKEQQIYEIGSVRVGGQPGQLPTVLMGSIFYEGDRIVDDQKKGLFDHARAAQLQLLLQSLRLRLAWIQPVPEHQNCHIPRDF